MSLGKTEPRTVRSVILDQHQETGLYGARGWLPGSIANDLLLRLDAIEKERGVLFVDPDQSNPGIYTSLLSAMLFAMASRHWGLVDRLILVLQWLKP